MHSSLEPADHLAVERVVHALEAAWNAGDGIAFGATMTLDADFVTVRAEHYRGRQAIADGHAGIFRTIFAGSKARYTIETVRLVGPDVALAHVQSTLDVPAGPTAGHHSALYSLVLNRRSDGWVIASFHNTLAPAPPRGPR